jgi:hypothetical protein
MKIETYECEELRGSEATTMAADAEAIELIEKLGLEGQRKLANPDTCTREPYREMTKLELFVWSSVCPEKTEVTQYRLSPIPLRVLQVIAYARELGIYTRLEVWHPKQVKEDPILVGVPNNEQWSSKRHLIARWGDVLVPFAELQERAKEVMARNFAAALDEIKQEVTRAEANIKARVERSFDAQTFDMPCGYHIANP